MFHKYGTICHQNLSNLHNYKFSDFFAKKSTNLFLRVCNKTNKKICELFKCAHTVPTSMYYCYVIATYFRALKQQSRDCPTK